MPYGFIDIIMSMEKVSWTNSEDRLTIAFPIAKVDKEKRTVSGFATLDNIDRHGDIVTSEASEKAFARFRGNIREMHQPIAVGKVVSFTPQVHVDKETGKTFKGVYVDAYVSKGAQDTWEKVLDGTLTGFSIGGNIVEASYQPGDTEDNRVIKDYELMELSLVDNPANPMANIFSIQKSAGVMTMKGMAADTEIENVFWCADDQIAKTSSQENLSCVSCGDTMTSIGWVEKSESGNGEAIMKTVASFFSKDDAPGPDHAATTHDADNVIDSDKTINLYPDQNKIKKEDTESGKILSKGGNEMEEENNVVEAEAVEELTEDAQETVDSDAVEKAATVSEVQVDELDFVKMVDTLKDETEKIQKNYADHAANASDMYAAVEDIKKSIGDYGTKTSELSNNVSELVKRLENLEKRIDAYEGDTAVRKSGEVEKASPEDTKITKSIWQGHFLGVQDI